MNTLFKQSSPKLIPLPCPFCGAIPRYQPEHPEIQGDAYGLVYCNNSKCHAKPQVRDGVGFADERGSAAYIDCAILNWNTRNETP
jgi:hypothetical protein